MPTTSGMMGKGFYDRNSGPQGAGMDAVLPWLVRAVDTIPLPDSEAAPFVLLDLGSSEGGNAIRATSRLVDAIRKRTHRPLWVFFSDLPTNDFNQLFVNLSDAQVGGLLGANVVTAAIAGDAYGRLLPARSLHVATSFNVVGWLDAHPSGTIPNHILPMSPSPLNTRASASEAECEPYRRQADDDLRRFYRARAEELAPGGKLLVQVFGRNDLHSASDGPFEVLGDALLDLVDDGTLPARVYTDLVFPCYFRSVRELIAPIDEDTGLNASFRVEEVGASDVDVPFNLERDATGDVGVWAAHYTGYLRAFAEPVLAKAVPDELAVSEIVEATFRRVEHLLATDPDRYPLHYVSVAALLTRI